MNRGNHIDARRITKHPVRGARVYELYGKPEVTVLAAKTALPGTIETDKNQHGTFQAGDYLVTDNPPTKGWVIREVTFEQTYKVVPEDDERFEPKITAKKTPRKPPERSIPNAHGEARVGGAPRQTQP